MRTIKAKVNIVPVTEFSIGALAEHDNQVRTKAIDEIMEAFNNRMFDSPMMNPIMTRNEILLFLQQLKEQKKR